MSHIVLLKDGMIFGSPIKLAPGELARYRADYRRTDYQIKRVTPEQADVIDKFIIHGKSNKKIYRQYKRMKLPVLYPIVTVYATENNGW